MLAQIARLTSARRAPASRTPRRGAHGLVSTSVRLPDIEHDFAVESAVYEAANTSARPWAICFHSSGLGARQWALAPQIAPEVNWLAVNFAGYGESTSWPRTLRPPTLADQAALVCAAVDALVPANAELHVLAHSYGGSVAIASCPHLAATRRVASLVMFEPNAFFMMPDAERASFKKTVDGWLDKHNEGDDEGFMELFYAFWFGEGAWQVLPKKTALKMRGTLRDLDLELVATIGEMGAERSAANWSAFLRSELGGARKHLMHGSLGTHARSLELAQVFRREAGFGVHETAALGAGHLAPFTHAETVLREMLALAGLPHIGEEGLAASHDQAATPSSRRRSKL